MSLNSLLKPVKFIDEQVERQYAKIRKRLDEMEINVYKIALPMNFIFLVTPPIINALAEGLYCGFDFSKNINGLLNNKNDKVTDGAVAVNKDNHLFGKITNTLRLPVFLTGAGLTIMGTYQLADTYLFSGNSNSDDGMHNLLIGLGWLSQASSVYLKNSDPKLLDKEPFWKKAYTWAKEKIGSLAPQPRLEPVPIHAYSGLENYIQTHPSSE